MGLKLSNIIVGFIILSILTALLSQIYGGLQNHYGITKTYTKDGLDVMDKLNSINIVSGMNSTITGMYKIGNPTATNSDIIGGLATAGIGFLKIATGIITLPIEIIGVITGFYYVPPEAAIALGLIFIIYLGFILIDNYTRGEN